MSVHSLLYRIIAIVLGIHMMAFAWPLRGQFGHAWGAAITGAMAGVIVSTLIPWKKFREVFAQAVFFGTLGFVLGGENIPYGALVNNILQQPNLASTIPQLLTVLFIGASWGGIGGLYLGYGISEQPMSIWDYAGIIALGAAAFAATLLFNSNAAIVAAFTILILLLYLYNFLFKHSRIVNILGLAGLVSFGAGFLGAVILLFLGTKGMLAGPPDWWTLRDQMWGGAGGLGLILAAFWILKQKGQPVPILQTGFQRFGFIFFVPGICGINTFNVYQKWFLSNPPAPNLVLAGVLITAGTVVLIASLIYFLITNAANLTTPALNATILAAFIFFSFYLRFFAIAKSIVYSGWGVWEPAFTLFLFESLLLAVTMPFILLGPQNP